MNLKNLPNEVGIPLSEFYRGEYERYRLALRFFQGAGIFRVERWIHPGPGGLWTFKVSDGLSLNQNQAQILGRGIDQGLSLLSDGAPSRSISGGRGNDD